MADDPKKKVTSVWLRRETPAADRARLGTVAAAERARLGTAAAAERARLGTAAAAERARLKAAAAAERARRRAAAADDWVGEWKAVGELLRNALAKLRRRRVLRTNTSLPGAYAHGDSSIAGDNIPVSIYLADEYFHREVETAVEHWLTTADVTIDTRFEPVIGSWFRRMDASVKRAVKTSAAREVLLTAAHIADSRLVQAQDAYVTATLLQNVGPVLQALQPTKDAVVRAGALVIVKIDWVVQVHQLTAAQQAILDHQPHLSASPTEIVMALQLNDAVSQEASLQSGAHLNNGGENSATTTN